MTLLEQFDSLFDLTRDRLLSGNGYARPFLPAADVLVNENEVTVTMDVPGLKPENLDIQLTDGVLTVTGERPQPFASDGEHDGRNWYRLERGYGRFQRILQVPRGLDPGQITASMTDGVLTLHIPQPETRKPHRITISGSAQPAIESHADAAPVVEAGSAGEPATAERELAGAPA